VALLAVSMLVAISDHCSRTCTERGRGSLDAATNPADTAATPATPASLPARRRARTASRALTSAKRSGSVM